MGLTNYRYDNLDKYKKDVKNTPRKMQFYRLVGWLGSYEAVDSLDYPKQFLETYAAYEIIREEKGGKINGHS